MKGIDLIEIFNRMDSELLMCKLGAYTSIDYIDK